MGPGQAIGAQALVAAIRICAETLGPSRHVGVIAPGTQADLVRGNGSPVEDPELFSAPNRAVLAIRAGHTVKDLR
ncbi:hypothetical protein [Streptomyces sp. NPDC058657]|uniref:hypothetical protein n=1 Tax=unclassified Streptomyces TaxID=2593676 RepID=UPI00364B6A1C